MCLLASVGKDGKNDFEDAVAVQTLLNWAMLTPLAQLTVDGKAGKRTSDHITEFQTRQKLTINGRVDPNGSTLKALRRFVPKGLTKEKLRAIAPQATHLNIEKYLAFLNSKMTAREIKTLLRQAHFLAQLAHESGSFRYAEEIASGVKYEGRKDLGNTQKGDGVKFKGRGLIQLTGRSNYVAYGDAIDVDLTTDDGVKTVAQPERAVDVACWFWQEHELNEIADADNVRKVTKKINGGYNGLADREHFLRRAKFFLGIGD